MCLINIKKWTHFRYVKKIWNFSSLAQNGYKKGQLRISALASQRRLGVKENHFKNKNDVFLTIERLIRNFVKHFHAVFNL